MENKKLELMTQDLSAGYDGKTIVSDVSITIPKNKISVILGANGCGKSTLLNMISGLYPLDCGTITLDGENISLQPEHQRAKKIGRLFQDPILGTAGDMQILENLALANEMMVSTELADRCVDELSGGQRQRVWIALALAQQTDILLLDEPTTYLDIAYQVEILDLLMELNKKRGTTILMVLHDINLSARYADHIFAMSKGKLVAQGSPSEVISRELMKQIYGLDCQIESRHHRQENTSAKKDTVEEKTEKEQIEASIKTESICA